MPKPVSIDDQNHAGIDITISASYDWSVAIFITSLESQESYLTLRNLTLQTFLSITRDFFRQHSTFARLYNAAASPASRLRSADSLAIIIGFLEIHLLFLLLVVLVTRAEEIFRGLEQMRYDAGKIIGQTQLLEAGLKKIASDRGFQISGNKGSGNCMFYALSEQLDLLKGIQISHEALRQHIVQYLKENPTLVS